MPWPLPPLVIDQASSATAFVNIKRAAEDGSSIPSGWAIDETGEITTDPARAVLGALLPFGGYKGANIALLVEILAAGLSGSSWSLDAGDFCSGERPLDTGLTIVAISPDATDLAFRQRVSAQFDRLRAKGVRIPGSRASMHPEDPGIIDLDTEIVETIKNLAERAMAHGT